MLIDWTELDESNVELIEGNVLSTLPAFLDRHQEHSFAIVNIDVDLYEGTRVAIEQLFPWEPIQKFAFGLSPSFIVKE